VIENEIAYGEIESQRRGAETQRVASPNGSRAASGILPQSRGKRNQPYRSRDFVNGSGRMSPSARPVAESSFPCVPPALPAILDDEPSSARGARHSRRGSPGQRQPAEDALAA
jgi:hypothetical protein